MRELKFRAWDKLRKEMLDVYEISFDSEQVAGYSPTKKKTRRLNPLDDDFDLMQFTGLKDKNGKRIFEGDILRKHGEVKYVGAGFWCVEPNDIGEDRNFMPLEKYRQVIGNIYENSELLTLK